MAKIAKIPHGSNPHRAIPIRFWGWQPKLGSLDYSQLACLSYCKAQRNFAHADAKLVDCKFHLGKKGILAMTLMKINMEQPKRW
jgi:hypothetical protein